MINQFATLKSGGGIDDYDVKHLPADDTEGGEI